MFFKRTSSIHIVHRVIAICPKDSQQDPDLGIYKALLKTCDLMSLSSTSFLFFSTNGGLYVTDTVRLYTFIKSQPLDSKVFLSL